jgi:hypothetical protein
VLLVVGCFELVEVGGVAQGEADVVEALDEAVLAERVDLEGGVEALCVADGLVFERDGELVVGCLCGAVEEEGYVFF